MHLLYCIDKIVLDIGKVRLRCFFFFSTEYDKSGKKRGMREEIIVYLLIVKTRKRIIRV